MRACLIVALLSVAALAGEARDVDGKEWKRIRKLLSLPKT